MEILHVEQSTRQDSAHWTLLAGGAIGVAGDLLFFGYELPGLHLTLWVLLFAMASIALNFQAPVRWRNTLILWFCIALSATGVLIWRSTPALIPLTLLVLPLCAVAVLLQARGTSLLEARILDYFTTLWRLPLTVLPGSLPLLNRLQRQGLSKRSPLFGVIRGLILVTPLLFIFIGLFSSADAQFELYMNQFGDLLTKNLRQHLLVIVLITWFSTGLLCCTFLRADVEESTAPRTLNFRLGKEETVVIMASLLLLFGAFVFVQAGYLFGGSALVEQRSGLTLADYARRGFFELLAVSTLTLVLLLCLSGLQNANRVFRPLAYGLIVCVFLILASALLRVGLYILGFGLSIDRLLACFFMLWLAVNLISFAATVLRGRYRGFASGLVTTAIAAIFLVAFVNPAALVARVNLERTVSHYYDLDWFYLLTLGADATPEILRYLPHLPEDVQCHLAVSLLSDYGGVESENWRQWNLSESIARERVLDRLRVGGGSFDGCGLR